MVNNSEGRANVVCEHDCLGSQGFKESCGKRCSSAKCQGMGLRERSEGYGNVNNVLEMYNSEKSLVGLSSSRLLCRKHHVLL